MEEFIKQIEPFYDEVSTNISLYSKKNRKVAEIDILARNKDKFDVFEVKCSYRVVKARIQLRKIRKLVPNVENTYFFCGEAGLLENII